MLIVLSKSQRLQINAQLMKQLGITSLNLLANDIQIHIIIYYLTNYQ